MPKNKPLPPAPRQQSRELLTTVETSTTDTSSDTERKANRPRVRGESVEIPSQELLGHTKPDWGKIGVYLTIALAALGGFWHYADTTASVKNLGDDVKDLKRRSEDLLRTSIETSTRLSSLERRDTQQITTAPPLASRSVPASQQKPRP